MSTLSDQLAALGIAPTEGGILPPVLTDEIDALLVAAFPHDAVVDARIALDVHHQLGLWRERLEWRLAREHGAKLATAPKYDRKACVHKLVEIDASKAELLCRTCGASINAVVWMSRHTEELQRAENLRRFLKNDATKLATEVDDLKRERSAIKQTVKRGKVTAAKQALRADDSEYLIPPTPKRKRSPKP